MKLDTIYQGDNVLVMSQIEDESIDLTVTSPPYDDLRDYHGFAFDFPNVAKQLYRVTKPGGVVVWVVGDKSNDGSETLTSFRQAIYFQELGFNVETMIYEKNGPAYPSQDKYYQVFEYMFVFSKGKVKTFNPIKDRKNKWVGEKWSSGRTRRTVAGELTKQEVYNGSENENGVRFNIWRYNTGAGYTTKDDYAFEHPAMFPEALAQDHILSWSNPGDIVLDPFVGSGTTAKMAKQNGRHWIGIDSSPAYCKLAEKRVMGANVPFPIFMVQP